MLKFLSHTQNSFIYQYHIIKYVAKATEKLYICSILFLSYLLESPLPINAFLSGLLYHVHFTQTLVKQT